MKFRIRKESSKPQTNYHCCLRFSYLVPYWLISRNTITVHKYLWCWNWKNLPRNGKVSTIGTYRFHELKLQAVSGHASKTRHYQLWDEVIFNRNWDPRWYSRRVKETQAHFEREDVDNQWRMVGLRRQNALLSERLEQATKLLKFSFYSS